MDVAQNFRQRQILNQNFTANPTVVFSSPGDSRSGDIQVRVRGQKVDVTQNFRQGQIVSQNFPANPTVLYSSTADFPFRR